MVTECGHHTSKIREKSQTKKEEEKVYSQRETRTKYYVDTEVEQMTLQFLVLALMQ